MSKVSTKSGFITAAEANKITPITNSKTDAFNRLWLWPSKAPTAGGKRTSNVGDVYVGERTDGGDYTPDVLGKDDMPMLIELPVGETKLLRDVIFQSDTAGDGLLFKFW